MFRQKIFHDVTDPDICVELFGHKLPTPAITAPVGSFSLIGKDAERQVAEGTERVGAMMFISQAAKFDPRDWRNACEVAVCLHGLYEPRQRGSRRIRQARSGLGLCCRRHHHGYGAAGEDRRRSAALDQGRQAAEGTQVFTQRYRVDEAEVKLPVVVKGIMSAEDAHER